MPPSGVDYASEFLNGYAPEYVPMDVIFGNGMGRNFLFRNLKKQANHSAKKRKKMEHGLIETVPLQTEKEPENIWN